ncbi:MAG: glycoside hydrolase family 43 protein [Hyphomonas sp.]|nr:glycoside hydrolase family 43 protein [Hyphomonas sp.]HRX72787.1 glycoside hydrolase family 43 protein [Hyphomonas sp.]
MANGWAAAGIAALAALGGCASTEEAYLFSSFRGDGEDGLHLAWSEDGYTWTALKGDQSFMLPDVGGKLMRDPCIIRGPDGLYHMVWTTGWWENTIGVAHSADLVHWSAQEKVPVMANIPDVMNTWAPEILWLEKSGEYLVFWSSSIPDTFPETADRGDIRSTVGKPLNHRIYAATTKDFETWSDTFLFYDGGFVSIDGTILQEDDRAVMFVKDETKRPVPEKNIRLALAKTARGPFGEAGAPVSPEGVWVEGPTAMKIGDTYYVYYDAYMEHRMGAMTSPDLVTWHDISDEISFPAGSRHGSVLKVSRAVIGKIIAATQE